MADKMIFTIRRIFLIPLGLLLLTQILLLGVCLVQGQTAGRSMLTGAIVLVLGVLFAENLFRRVDLTETGISICRLFRRKELQYKELTGVEAVTLRKRVFITLWKEDDFLLVSNAYKNFPILTAELTRRIPEGIISEEAAPILADPPSFHGHTFICWMALGFSLLILWKQLSMVM